MATTKNRGVTIRHGVSHRTSRDYARCVTEQGFCLLARAFNACDEPGVPYRYSPAVIARFKAVMVEVIGLIETGEITELLHLADNDFRRFMAQFVDTSAAP